ncbi:MAG: redox-sensing transcriptional repressor Rex [Actinobacteria bacterium]|nr:redox-sensing transcriptional repressor Rex [Actinomycetota bacterium]MCI0544653.1 redox-sensing transcriptional repressor Rex [Actinomycetota bacterium]MCI0679649.1 redox-sensing transcriptional repressor Rex [Actinomycetota bacterium]
MSGLSTATVTRLPRYLRLLEEMPRETVSSEELAGAAGVTAANARRDLAALGFQGIRGVGYLTTELRDRIRKELGIETRRRVGIVGAGNLGTALARYTGLSKRGFDVAVIYDVHPGRVGQRIGDLTIRHLDDMTADLEKGVFDMAILAVPAGSAQKVADALVEAGVASILNFAPTRVSVPKSVAMRQVDLSNELQILSYYG